MAFNQVSANSLTPSRPAPQVPQRSNTPSSFNLASPSGSYASSYSGIGGSPNRNTDVNVVRAGTVSLKEDGFASWLWRPKWLVLREQTLTIHKNEVRLILRFISSISIMGTFDLYSDVWLSLSLRSLFTCLIV
jgi:serine/threonine-protein kinase CLA4